MDNFISSIVRLRNKKQKEKQKRLGVIYFATQKISTKSQLKNCRRHLAAELDLYGIHILKKILIAVMLLSLNSYSGEIKKWTDSAGNVHFGDELPGEKKVYSNTYEGSSFSSKGFLATKEQMEAIERLSKNAPTEQYDKDADHSKGKKKGIVITTFDGLPVRSKENIISTLDSEKESLFKLYNSLSGTGKKHGGDLTVELLIFSDGSIINCSILASSLNNKEIEGKLLEKVRKIRFSSDNVKPTNYTYTFKFP